MGGCSAFDLQPLTSPNPAQDIGYAEELTTIAGPKRILPKEYLAASIVHSEQKCEEFFNALSRFKQDSTMFDKVLAAALAAGTPLFPIYHVSQAAQTVFTGSIGTTQSVSKSYAEVYAFTPYSEELRRLVKDAQQAYLDGEKVKSTVAVVYAYSGDASTKSKAVTVTGSEIKSVTLREAFLAARLVANGYAAQCSLANLHALVRESITSANIKRPPKADSPPPDASPVAEADPPAAARRQRVVRSTQPRVSQ